MVLYLPITQLLFIFSVFVITSKTAPDGFFLNTPKQECYGYCVPLTDFYNFFIRVDFFKFVSQYCE